MSRALALLLAAAAIAAPPPARGAPEIVGPELVGEPPAVDEPAPLEPLREPPLDDDDNWLDAGHAFVERRLFAPVLRFDRFFSDERDLDPDRARSFLRWRNELRFDQESTPTFNTGVSATIRLPGLRKQLRRLRIEIVGQTQDAITALFPDETDRDQTPAERLGSADAGLRYRLWETLRAHGDIGGGVLLRLPPGVYGRARIRSVLPLGRRLLSRQAVTGFWRTDTHFGASASAELERPITPANLVARVLGTANLTEVSRGLEWLGDVALLATFHDRSGAQVGASVTGATDRLAGQPPVDRYRIYTRLRQDLYRHWVFVDLEPEYAWPWAPERGRHATWGITLRLEVQFRGNEPPQEQERESRSGPALDDPARLGAALAARAPG